MAARRRAIVATGFPARPGRRVCLRRSSAGGPGKSGEKPARSRHCDRALMRRTIATGGPTASGKARRGARKPGDLTPAGPIRPSRKGWLHEEPNPAARARRAARCSARSPRPRAAAPVSVNCASRAQQHDLRRPGHDRRPVVTPGAGGAPHLRRDQRRRQPAARPDAAGALDDAAPAGRLHVGRHLVPDSFADFLVSASGRTADHEPAVLGLLRRTSSSPQVGGCQERVKGGDEVLWAFDAFSKTHAAEAHRARRAATTGEPVDRDGDRRRERRAAGRRTVGGARPAPTARPR